MIHLALKLHGIKLNREMVNGIWGIFQVRNTSEMHQLYMDDVISKDEFLEWYRNPKNYRPELPGTNRSHKYE